MVNRPKLTASLTNPVENAFDFALSNFKESFLKENATILEHSEDIKHVMGMLGDDASRQQYNQELAYKSLLKINEEFANRISPFSNSRYLAAYEQMPNLMSNPKFPRFKTHSNEAAYLKTMVLTTFALEQYRYKNIVNVVPGEVFIDCGACFGDTTLWAYMKGATTVYSFEPGEVNLDILKLNLTNNDHDTSKVVPAAVGEENTTIKFFSGPGIAGAACQADEKKIEEVAKQTQSEEEFNQFIQTVNCIRLDDWFTENNVEPTFIKMDIEGAEVGALKGAAEMIKRRKPKLAICLYHKLTDMWEVPLLIKSLVPEYQLYCRKNHIKNEFVLYAAVPQ